jgi:hypothetical protein
MTTYTFRDAPLFLHNGEDADPQVIGEALEQIAAANGGLLTPAALVTAARSRRHPCNKHFEWRDKEAAEQYRLEQARSLIRMIRVVDEQQPEMKHYAFVNIRTEDGRGYVSPQRIVTSELLQARALEMAERELSAIERRYAEISDLCAAIREWRGRLADRRRQLIEDPPLRRRFG